MCKTAANWAGSQVFAPVHMTPRLGGYEQFRRADFEWGATECDRVRGTKTKDGGTSTAGQGLRGPKEPIELEAPLGLGSRWGRHTVLVGPEQ